MCDMAVEAMKAGTFEFFEKPFRMQDLCDKIQAAVKSNKETWQRHKEREDAENRLASLTPAERQVMELLVDGKTNREIAADLALSLRAVEDRRARMMKRLQVKSRADCSGCSSRAQAFSSTLRRCPLPGPLPTAPPLWARAPQQAAGRPPRIPRVTTSLTTERRSASLPRRPSSSIRRAGRRRTR